MASNLVEVDIEKQVTSFFVKNMTVEVTHAMIDELLFRYKFVPEDFELPSHKEIVMHWHRLRSNGVDNWCKMIMEMPVEVRNYANELCILPETEWLFYSDIEKLFIEYRKIANERRAKRIVLNAHGKINSDNMLEHAEYLKQQIEEIETKKDTAPITGSELGKFLLKEKFHQSKLLTCSSGFKNLDHCLQGGFSRTSLNVIAGRPGQGKTSFALNIILAALFRKQGAAIFTLEQSKLETCEAVISIMHGEDAKKDTRIFSDGSQQLSEMKLHISDMAKLTTSEIALEVKRLKANNPIDFVMIDYLGLLAPCTVKKNQTKQLEIADMTRELKILAKDQEVPILLLVQMNRAIEEKKRKPLLSDLRDSGSIEQDADTVMFVTQAEEKNMDGSVNSTIFLEKNRHGMIGICRMTFRGWTKQFMERE